MPGLDWSWWMPPCGEGAERTNPPLGLWRSRRLRRSIPQGFRFADTPIQVLDGFRRDFQPLAFPAVGPRGLPSHHLPGKVESQQMPERFGFGSMIPIEVTVWIDARPEQNAYLVGGVAAVSDDSKRVVENQAWPRRGIRIHDCVSKADVLATNERGFGICRPLRSSSKAVKLPCRNIRRHRGINGKPVFHQL